MCQGWGQETACGFGEPCRAPGRGPGPERLTGARTEGLGCPLIVWTLQQGNDTYRSVSKKKNAFAATAQSRRGAREAVPTTFNHQGDKDREGPRVGAGAGSQSQDRELTGLGSCCADYGWGEDSRRCQADEMSASAPGQGWVTTCGQVWGEWRM